MTTDATPEARIGRFEHRSMSCALPGCADDHLHRRPYKSAEPWVAGTYVQSEAGSTWTPVHLATAPTEPAPPPFAGTNWDVCAHDHVVGTCTLCNRTAPPPVADLRAELAEVTAAHAQALVTIAELRRQLDGKAKP